MKKLLLYTLLLAAVFNSTAQLRIPERPNQIPFVIDSTNTLSLNEKSILNTKLKNYCLSTSTEILVMMVHSTNGNTIETYAKELGQQWGIGKLGKDNGMVILIAKDERKMSIQNGHGIEAILSNKATKRIIDEVITPEFKKGDFFKGISDGLNSVFDILKNEFTNEGNATELHNFITEGNPPVIQKFAEDEKPVKEEGEPIGLAGALIMIFVFLFIFSVIVYAIIKLIRNRKQILSQDYTQGGYGGNHTVYNHVHINNNINNRPRRSFFSRSNYSNNSGSSNSSGSSSSNSSSSSSNGSSGSGGTYGGGGASGGW